MSTRIVQGRVYEGSRAVGRNASTGLGFTYPIDVALGKGDAVYVLSRGQEGLGFTAPWNRMGLGCRVSKLTVGKVEGDEEFIGQFSSYGDEEGRIIWSAGIAVNGEETVYVADEWMNRVSIFDKDGNYHGFWGSPGDGDGQFNGASGIATDRDDNVFVVDSRNHRVQKFSKDGRFLAKWGTHGSADGELDSPWGITTDHEGYVYVADHKNHRAQKFTPDGQFLAKFGSYGTGRGQLNHPSDVAVDPEGDVYVCDWGNHRVQAYGPDGAFLTSFFGDAQELSKWAQMLIDANPDAYKARRRVYTMEPEWRFPLPPAVAFDGEKGHLVVVDCHRNRLQIYTKLKGYVDPQFNL